MGKRTWPEAGNPLRQIVDNSSAVIFIKDIEGRYRLVNPAFERLFGVPAERVLGRDDHQLFPGEIADALLCNDRRVVEQGRSIEVEEQVLWQGRQYTYLTTKFPICDSHGQVVGVGGIAADISERKRTEDALRHVALGVSRATGNAVFPATVRYLASSLQVDFAFVSHASRPDSTHLSTLAASYRGEAIANFDYVLQGTPCAEVFGQRFLYIPQGLGERYPLDALLKHIRIDSYAGYPLFASDGRPLGLIAVGHASELPERERVESVLRIFSVRVAAEVERATLEQQLRQAQRMEAIGHLTGGIAHDFNNLLTSMLGYTQMAEELAGERGDAPLGRYLGRIRQSAEKARDLIRQMLVFSRGSRGQPRVVSLAALVEEFRPLLQSALPAGIELDLQLGQGLAPVRVDPLQLEQVLMNLCINARDAMNGSGRLRIALHARSLVDGLCASCQQRIAGDFQALCVEDSGPGIDESVQHTIFEPFYTTKAPGQGSGMGLSMVHGLVHEYGGHLLLHSQPGKGARFEVLLPGLPGSPAVSARPAGDHETPREQLRGRVCVVDDDPLVGEYLQDCLSHWGLQVTVWSDAEQARTALLAEPGAWDALILDQSMPRLCGLALAKQVLAVRADLPIALHSGFSDPDDERTARQLGLTLLHKPVAAPVLHDWLSSRLPG
ncbi:PAS domain-containing protein [Pseudomonas sp. RL]|uniref:hybrid sensor histidine kinase/response regulator n=1 Tax=Pseudomonas sp. RL TaxID=1452718 RepID=UPI00068CDF07|nr:PAS domain-containing protein [Pseudomonas sp. RL]